MHEATFNLDYLKDDMLLAHTELVLQIIDR